MTDLLLRWMKRHKVPVTREKYLALAWGSDNLPEPWTPEHEEELPESTTITDFDPDQPRAPAGSPEGGQWTSTGGGGGFEFVSPNIEQTSFEGALRGLTSDRQRALRLAANEIDASLGLDSAHSSIVGAWSDGAENSILSEVNNPNWDQLKLSGAMKGYLADQKAVLLFKQADDGKAVLYKWGIPGTLESAHNELAQAGIENHTLQRQGADVIAHVVDLDGSLHDKIASASKGADVEYQFGRAEFIGTTKEDGTDREQRDDARRAYAEIIKQSPVQNGSEVWDRVHNRWGEALDPKSGKIVQIGGNQPFEVMINSSERDLRGMAQDSFEHTIRVAVDRNDNLYAWEADKAIHASIENELDLDLQHQDEWVLRQGQLVSKRHLDEDHTLKQARAEARSWMARTPGASALNRVLKDAAQSSLNSF